MFCFVFVWLYWRRFRACKTWPWPLSSDYFFFINYCFDVIKWQISNPFFFTQRFHRDDIIWFIVEERAQEVSSVLWCWISCYYKGLGFCVRLKKNSKMIKYDNHVLICFIWVQLYKVLWYMFFFYFFSYTWQPTLTIIKVLNQ